MLNKIAVLALFPPFTLEAWSTSSKRCQTTTAARTSRPGQRMRRALWLRVGNLLQRPKVFVKHTPRAVTVKHNWSDEPLLSAAALAYALNSQTHEVRVLRTYKTQSNAVGLMPTGTV